MKVKLLVNLKIGSGKIIDAGTIFDSSKAPIPDCILRRIPRRKAEIVSGSLAELTPKTPATAEDVDAVVGGLADDAAAVVVPEAAAAVLNEAAAASEEAPKLTRKQQKAAAAAATVSTDASEAPKGAPKLKIGGKKAAE